MPLFTVVIPAYNAEKYIGRCIDSVLCQSFKDFEVIVVNNYSQDNTEEILKSYSDDRLRYFNESNNGIIAHSRNFGVNKSKGDWICFLDADDWWDEYKLEKVYTYISSYDLIYHRLRLAGEYKGLMKKYIGWKVYKDNLYEKLVVNGNIAPTSSISVRKELYIEAGMMSEVNNMVGVEDSDCWFRIARISNKWKFIDKPLGYYHIGGNTSLSMKQIERERVLLENHKENLPLRAQKEAFKTLQYKQARICHKLGNYSEAVSLYKESFSRNRFFKTSLLMAVSFIYSLKK